ncbi:MAG: hypothetical protein JO265_08805, partial [Acidimicrobiia bacterium]|nr:hypothetical protein [Acidimicrobiia bacterium]
MRGGGSPIVIAIGLDGGYAPCAATLLRSCIAANPSASFCFEVVHDGTLSGEDCERLAKAATSDHLSVRFHCVASSDLPELPTTPFFGSIVWLRFTLPDQ